MFRESISNLSIALQLYYFTFKFYTYNNFHLIYLFPYLKALLLNYEIKHTTVGVMQEICFDIQYKQEKEKNEYRSYNTSKTS